MQRTLWISCAILIAGLAVAGCSRKVVYKEKQPDVVVIEKSRPGVVIVEQQHQGPPAHAPAHGYRKKHAGNNVTLVYSPDLQVYVVNGHRHCYYSAGQYFRLNATTWEWSVDMSGPWRVVRVESDIPPSLRKHHVYKMDRKAEKAEKKAAKKNKKNDGDEDNEAE